MERTRLVSRPTQVSLLHFVDLTVQAATQPYTDWSCGRWMDQKQQHVLGPALQTTLYGQDWSRHWSKSAA